MCGDNVQTMALEICINIVLTNIPVFAVNSSMGELPMACGKIPMTILAINFHIINLI